MGLTEAFNAEPMLSLEGGAGHAAQKAVASHPRRPSLPLAQHHHLTLPRTASVNTERTWLRVLCAAGATPEQLAMLERYDQMLEASGSLQAANHPRGHQRPPEATRGHQIPSEAIRGHQRSPEVTRGHQRLSEIARDHKRPPDIPTGVGCIPAGGQVLSIPLR